MTEPVVPISYPDFPSAARGVLDFLKSRLGFDLWMVTRTEGEDWIVLDVEETGYGVSPGVVFNWADSFCSRMVKGLGPRVAADAASFPAYASAPIARRVPIGAYVGVPIPKPGGDLFGTLCAIHPTPQPDRVTAEQPLVELLAGMLAGVLSADLKAGEQARAAERAKADAFRDEETGLYTRKAWEELLDAEEVRCRRFGHPAFVAAVSIPNANAVQLFDATKAIDCAIRPTDIVARVGANELAVLGVEGGQPLADLFVKEATAWLAKFRVPAQVSVALRTPRTWLTGAWEKARAGLGI